MKFNLLEVGVNALSNNIFNLASDLKLNSQYVLSINKEKTLFDAVKKINEVKGNYVLYLSESDYVKFTKEIPIVSAGSNGEFYVGNSLVFLVVSNLNYVQFIENIVNFKKNNKYTVYKLYNVSTKKIKGFFDLNDLAVEIISDGLDVKVRFDISDYSEVMKWEFLKKFLLEFKEYIYAESDISLAGQLVKILKMRGIKMSCAESFTAGGIASYVTSISGSSEVFYEGIVAYNEESKEDRLGVEKSTILIKKPVSSQTCYEMCKGLLDKGVEVAVATTGLAGPNSDGSTLPVGLVFIAVGTIEKISVYKYNFKGSRKDITNRGIETAVFLLIKSLRDNSFSV